MQVLTLIYSAYLLFYNEDPNFNSNLKIKSFKLKEEGLHTINTDLITNQIEEINFLDFINLIIEYVSNFLKKYSSKLNLRLYQKLFIWVKFIK